MLVSFRPPGVAEGSPLGRMATSDAEKLNGEVFQAKSREARKYAREDFDFEKILGEGSYSTVSSTAGGAC